MKQFVTIGWSRKTKKSVLLYGAETPVAEQLAAHKVNARGSTHEDIESIVVLPLSGAIKKASFSTQAEVDARAEVHKAAVESAAKSAEPKPAKVEKVKPAKVEKVKPAKE